MTQLLPLIKGCCPEGKRRVLLTVSYDGTAYAGWQRQQNALAVQQVLEEALRKALFYSFLFQLSPFRSSSR